MSPKIEDDEEFEAAAPPEWPEPEFELTLRKPVTFKDETYSVVLLREPTGAEWEEMLAQPTAIRRRFMISKVGGIPMAATALIGIGDLVRGETYLMSFFDTGQAIGAR